MSRRAAESAMPSRSSGACRKPVTPCVDDLRQPADARRDDRHLAGHRLERREAEALLRRRQQEHVRNREQRHHLILLAEKLRHRRRRPAPARAALRRDAFGTVAHHQQRAPDMRGGRCANTSIDRLTPLHRPEVGHVDQNFSPPGASRSRSAGDLAPLVQRGSRESSE